MGMAATMFFTLKLRSERKQPPAGGRAVANSSTQLHSLPIRAVDARTYNGDQAAGFSLAVFSRRPGPRAECVFVLATPIIGTVRRECNLFGEKPDFLNCSPAQPSEQDAAAEQAVLGNVQPPPPRTAPSATRYRQLSACRLAKAGSAGLQANAMTSCRTRKNLIKQATRRLMAEREGFEPSIGSHLYTLSRRAPSAARTPLRWRRRTSRAPAPESAAAAAPFRA